MKNLFRILIVFLSFVITQEDGLEFYQIQDEINIFLKNEIAISNKQFKSDDVNEYSYKLSEMKNWLEMIDGCLDCYESQKNELRYKLHYQFSKSTMLRYGEMVSYQASLDKSIQFIKRIIEKLNSDEFYKDIKDCSKDENNIIDCYFIPEIYSDQERKKSYLKRLNKNLNKYKSEQNILKNQYKDIKVFIKNKKFDEMLEIVDKELNNRITISLDVPPIFYDNSFKSKFTDKELSSVTDSTKKLFETQFDRIEILKNLTETFKLTSYDKDKGFYFKIPMVPIIQENKRTDIRHSYAIVINSGTKVTKFRFELTTKSEKSKPFDYWEIDPLDHNWNYEKKEVPFDWTKIEIDNDNNWIYEDSEGSQICSFNKSTKELKLNPAYREICIPIYNGDNEKIILYQKDTGDIDGYRLKFLEDKTNKIKEILIKSIKYLMFIMLFGIGYAETI